MSMSMSMRVSMSMGIGIGIGLGLGLGLGLGIGIRIGISMSMGMGKMGMEGWGDGDGDGEEGMCVSIWMDRGMRTYEHGYKHEHGIGMAWVLERTADTMAEVDRQGTQIGEESTRM